MANAQISPRLNFYDEFSLSWLVFTLCLLSNHMTYSSINDVEIFPKEWNEFKFNHLVVDEDQGWVYIGAINHLYQLNSNLELVSNFSVIKQDSTSLECDGFECRSNEVKKSFNNYNKILVLDYENSQLLSCWSISYGLCKIYNIGNPLREVKTVNEPIVSDNENALTTAFIASHRQKWKSETTLYVGVTYTNQEKQPWIPAITTRILGDSKKLFKIFEWIDHEYIFRSASITLQHPYQKKYINYIYGFSSGSHSYFLTTQTDNIQQPSQYVSKLIRVCQKGTMYNSYTEIPIECQNDEGIKYNLAQAAFAGKPGSKLADSLGITPEDDVLFGIFTQSKEQTLGNDSRKSNNKSAMCTYSLEEINKKFIQNIQNCFNGTGFRGLELMISPNKKCIKDKTKIDTNFCAANLNMPLEGKFPVKVNASVTFDTLVKAIIAIPNSKGFTTIFVGTNTGHLIQILLKNKSNVCKYNNITIDEGFTINSDLHFNSKTDHLYIMTERKLTKIKVPFPTPSITTFKPTLGLVGENTNITIQVDNLGCAFEDIQHSIEVAGLPCEPIQSQYIPFKEIVCSINITSMVQKESQGPVKIKVDGTNIESRQHFKIVDSKIKAIFPRQGSVYGGTKLTINGENFDTENSISVFIGNISCPIFYCNQNEIKCITSPSSILMEGNVIIKFAQHFRVTNLLYMYINDTNRDKNGFNLLPKGIPAGGIIISIHLNIDLNMKSIQEMIFQVKNNGVTYNSTKCKKINSILMACLSPRMEEFDRKSIDGENPEKFDYTLLVTRNETNSTTSYIDVNSSKFLLYPNPIFEHFFITQLDGKLRIIIKGKNIDNACQKKDFTVRAGNDTCYVILLSQSEMVCQLQKSGKHHSSRNISEEQLNVFFAYENITLRIGNNKEYNIPKAKEENKPPQTNHIMPYLISGFSILGIIISALIFFCLIYRRKFAKNSKQMQEQMNRLELCVAAECKEAFAELQTEIFNSTSHIFTNSLPYLDYQTFVMKNAFPNIDDHSLILSRNTTLPCKDETFQLMGQLINNKTFILIFIRTLESLESFPMNDRMHVASLLMITLQNKMEYCTDILLTLLADLIKKYVQGKTHPKLLLRRTESMVEKMLSIWFTFLLYESLTESVGEPLFKLFRAVQQRINKGPVDMVTSEARYSLNEEKLLRQFIDYHPITVYIDVSQEIAAVIGLESAVEMTPVNVLDCDTISQVKEKVLEILCHNVGFSKRPKASTFYLTRLTYTTPEYTILYDDDFSSKFEGGWKQKNTLLHYGVQDGGTLSLVPIKNMCHDRSFDSYLEKKQIGNKFRLLSSSFNSRSSSKQNDADVGDEHKEWHLIKPHISDSSFDDHKGCNKMVSEIYLTRLLATKGTLQHFVDDLFKAILRPASQSNCFPMAIKYMFDFLDYQAFIHGVTDPEVVYTWKSNCLPLRFWVNLIKNPNFLLDIHKSDIVDSCLSVVAQAFMDSFSTAKLNLGKNSPTSKLLYAKDIPFYKQLVKKYYSDIKAMPAISHKDMSTMLTNESLLHTADFNNREAIYKLYKYMVKYNKELMIALKKDTSSLKYSLAQILDELDSLMAMNSNLLR